MSNSNERPGWRSGPDGESYYSPYSDLFGSKDQHHYKVSSRPEFLFPDEAAFQRRSMSENIQFYTGCGYFAGATLGGVKGLGEGVRAFERGDTLKLKTNRLLNASGHAGRGIGNKMGVLGLLYACMESGAWHLRKTDDLLNSVAAGLGTGAIYKAAAGPRTAVIAGALGGMAAGGLVAGKQVFKRYLPI